jgi:penicillin V acylase-like amidase (Ntn superfamily)
MPSFNRSGSINATTSIVGESLLLEMMVGGQRIVQFSFAHQNKLTVSAREYVLSGRAFNNSIAWRCKFSSIHTTSISGLSITDAMNSISAARGIRRVFASATSYANT